MLDNHPKLKSFLHYLLVHPYTSRPRWWARTFINQTKSKIRYYSFKKNNLRKKKRY